MEIQKYIYLTRNSDRIDGPAGAAGTELIALDGESITDDLTLFEQIATAFKFPSYFGNNWNALEDCLSDMSWMPAGAYKVMWSSGSSLLLHSPQTFFTFLQLFVSVAEWWRDRGVTFYMVLVDEYIYDSALLLAKSVSVCDL